MSVKEIEAAIAQLPAKEVSELMNWLAEHHAQLWDKQIEDNLEAGRLDSLLANVEHEYQHKQLLFCPQCSILTERVRV